MQIPTGNIPDSDGTSQNSSTLYQQHSETPKFVSFELEPCRLANGKTSGEEIQKCQLNDPDVGFWAVNKLSENRSKLDAIFVQTRDDAERVLDAIDAGERPDLFEPGEKLRPFVLLERGRRVVIHTAPSERAFSKAMGLPMRTHLLTEYRATFAMGTRPGLRRFDFGGWGRGANEQVDPLEGCKRFLKEEGIKWATVEVRAYGPTAINSQHHETQELAHHEKPSLLLRPIHFVAELWRERTNRNQFARELGFKNYRHFVAQTGDHSPEQNGLNQWKGIIGDGTNHRIREGIPSRHALTENAQRDTEASPTLIDPARVKLEQEMTSRITVVVRQLLSDYSAQLDKGRVESAALIVKEATDFVGSLKGPKLEAARLKHAVSAFITSDAENAARARVDLGVSTVEFSRRYDFERAASQRLGIPAVNFLRIERVQDDLSNALRVAAKYGQNELVTKYLSEGANVQADDNIALMEAASNGHTHTVALLVNRGADPTAKQKLAHHLAASAGHRGTLAYLQTATFRLAGHSQRLAQGMRHSI